MASWVSKVSRIAPPGAAPRRGVFLLMTCALVAISIIFGVVMVDARGDARRAAEASNINLATALAQDLARNVELLDLSIQAARDTWQDPRTRTLPPDLRQMVVFDHSTSARYIEAILVIGPDGLALADSRSTTPVPRNFTEADFFKAQVKADDGLFISRPMKAKDGNGWRMAFSRRLSELDGRFAGVAVGFLHLDYLSQVYQRLPLGQGGVLTLFNSDGTLLVREPVQADAIGRSLRGRSAFTQMSQGEVGAFEDLSAIDGQQRLYAYHRVGNLPLIQSVATSTEAVYAEWRVKAVVLGGVLILLLAGTLVLMFLLQGELRQRTKAETALRRWATVDDLTGLLNRRRFFELAEERCGSALGASRGASVLMIDADHFKSYNDRYGHLAGDAVLTAIGSCIGGEVRRDADLAARFGGEEFIVLLVGTNPARAFVIAEAIRSAVARLATPHERAAAGIVTVSIGLATAAPGLRVDLASLVEAADAELYRSKRSGRNRSSAADDPVALVPARSASA